MRNVGIFFVLTFLLTGMLYAEPKARTDDPAEFAIVKSNDYVRVVYAGKTPVNLEVFIMTEDGQEIFSEKIRQPEGFVRPYNLSELERGIYTIIVSNGIGSIVRDIELKTPVPQEAFATHAMKLDFPNGSRYLLTVPEQGLSEVTVEVYDSNHNLLYEHEVDTRHGYAKVYNIKGLRPQESVSFQVWNKKGEVVSLWP